MTNFLVLIVIGLLVYIICEYKKEGKEVKKEISYKEVLPQYLNKNCEIILKESLVSIDALYSVKGVLTDVDEEWIMLEMVGKSKKKMKVLRIDNISGIKEIVVA